MLFYKSIQVCLNRCFYIIISCCLQLFSHFIDCCMRIVEFTVSQLRKILGKYICQRCLLRRNCCGVNDEVFKWIVVSDAVQVCDEILSSIPPCGILKFKIIITSQPEVGIQGVCTLIPSIRTSQLAIVSNQIIFAFNTVVQKTVALFIVSEQIINHQRTLRMLGVCTDCTSLMQLQRMRNILIFHAPVVELRIRSRLLCFHVRNDGAVVSLCMMLICAAGTRIHLFTGITVEVQNIFTPYAHVVPLFHQIRCFVQSITLHIRRCYSVSVALHYSPEVCEVTNTNSVEAHIICLGRNIATKYTAHQVLSCNIPRDTVRLIVLDPLEILSQLFKLCNCSIRNACLCSPVTTVEHTLVSILDIIVFRNEIDFILILTDIPITIFSNLCVSFRRISLQHFLRQRHKRTFDYVLPAIQPIGSGSDQIQGSIAAQQLQIILSLPISPLYISVLQFCVYFFCQDGIQLFQHGLQSSIGRTIAQYQHIDDFMG